MQLTFRSHDRSIRIHQLEPATTRPHPALLLLHGAGGNIAFWLDRVVPYLQAAGVSLYAPHYFDRTQTQRADPATILDGIHVPQWLETVADALTYVRSRPNVDANRIALLGVSLGAFLSLAHAATQPASVRAVVEISGGLVEPYAALATSAFPPTLILHGEQDQVVSVDQARALDTTLTRLNVPHQIHILAGESHWFTAPAQLRMLTAVTQFLAHHL